MLEIETETLPPFHHSKSRGKQFLRDGVKWDLSAVIPNVVGVLLTNLPPFRGLLCLKPVRLTSVRPFFQSEITAAVVAPSVRGRVNLLNFPAVKQAAGWKPVRGMSIGERGRKVGQNPRGTEPFTHPFAEFHRIFFPWLYFP